MDRDENTTRTIDACAPDPGTVDRVLGGAHHDPHSVLGAHPHPEGTVVRVLRPHADEVHVVLEGGAGHPLVKVHEAGLFSGLVPAPPADYRLAVRYGERVDIVDDPYRWLPTLGEVDLHLIGEGRHERLWDVLGAHIRTYDTPAGEVTGTSFAVWAPAAQGVRVTGDFDGWAGWAHPMRVLGSTGVWELFVPGVGTGTRYKFRVLGQDGRWRDKADPMAFRAEVAPATASIVDVDTHVWADGDWLADRARKQAHAEPMSVYEVHLGSWRQGLDYREAARQLVAYLDETGFTHIELLPVAEHPFGGSWGYQVTSYYAPTGRFGTPDDFRWFVDHLHQHGYGVIVDWVPAHFPRDEWALAKFDGGALYEHADPRRGEQPDWGTLVFDFGRKEVRNFLVANALYWLESFHIDGLRVDAVASMLYLDYSRRDGQWLPNIHGGRENLDAVAFLQEMNATVYREHPGVVTIAEESTAWPGVSRPTHLGGLGFGFKWNMGWMHDTLDYTGRDPIYRGYHHNQMTFSLMYAFSENYVLPISHDEVVHGKGSLWERMPGDRWNKAANVRALLAFMWAHPGKQLLFMGSEFGQPREWSEERSLDWESLADPLHGGIKTMVGDMNRAYRAHSALWTKDVSPEGFSWIDANDTAGNVFSFLRHGVDADGRPTVLACIANFSGGPRDGYRVGLPFGGRWREVLNTDAEAYGGSGVGNLGAVEAEPHVWHGRPASALLRLPPSGVLWLAPEPYEGAVRPRAVASAAATAPAVTDAGSITDAGPVTDAPAAGGTGLDDDVAPVASAGSVPVDDGSEPDSPASPADVPPGVAATDPIGTAGAEPAGETETAAVEPSDAGPGPFESGPIESGPTAPVDAEPGVTERTGYSGDGADDAVAPDSTAATERVEVDSVGVTPVGTEPVGTEPAPGAGATPDGPALIDLEPAEPVAAVEPEAVPGASEPAAAEPAGGASPVGDPSAGEPTAADPGSAGHTGAVDRGAGDVEPLSGAAVEGVDTPLGGSTTPADRHPVDAAAATGILHGGPVELIGTQPVGTQPVGTQPVGTQPVGTGPASGDAPVEDDVTDAGPAGSTTTSGASSPGAPDPVREPTAPETTAEDQAGRHALRPAGDDEGPAAGTSTSTPPWATRDTR